MVHFPLHSLKITCEAKALQQTWSRGKKEKERKGKTSPGTVLFFGGGRRGAMFEIVSSKNQSSCLVN